MASRLKIKKPARLQFFRIPEAAMVTIVETVIKSQRQGALLGQILAYMENHRKSPGSDPQAFSEIMGIASGPIDEAGESVGIYCCYRLNIEHPGRVSPEQGMQAVDQCALEIATW